MFERQAGGSRFRRGWLQASAVLIAGAVLAGCGSSGGAYGASGGTGGAGGTGGTGGVTSTAAAGGGAAGATGTTATKATSSHATTVRLATTKLGRVLVNAKGMTLYEFTGDTATKSNCTGKCATLWPPLTVSGKPVAGHGVGGTLSTLARSGGRQQVEIAGHPLYTYSGDSKPGQTAGEGLLGKWFAVSASGSAVKAGATAAAKLTATATTTTKVAG